MTQATVACRSRCALVPLTVLANDLTPVFAARVLQCLLKLSLQSNQMPSQRVAPLRGGGSILCMPFGGGGRIKHVGFGCLAPRVKCCSSV